MRSRDGLNEPNLNNGFGSSTPAHHLGLIDLPSPHHDTSLLLHSDPIAFSSPNPLPSFILFFQVNPLSESVLSSEFLAVVSRSNFLLFLRFEFGVDFLSFCFLFVIVGFPVDHGFHFRLQACVKTSCKSAVQLFIGSVVAGPVSWKYLFVPNVLSAAVSRKCTMLHPGYGFLAENAGFVDICKEHGIHFIGPNVSSLYTDCWTRETMKKAGVPTVPGSDGLLQATAGGGGRGMRLAKEPEEFVKLLQVLADKFGNVVHFGERDCSIQKLLEEAPSPALTPELRKAMGDAAVAAASSIGYIGVGTVEFLLDERGSFYFMEMNTRIQEDIVLRGHSIECRINAEDAFKGFRPGPVIIILTGVPTTIDYHKLILDVEVLNSCVLKAFSFVQ
ncbi:hypothetical protein BHE74_00009988 [Ensete ventricosum]|nr:hypothetical protein BHE74_00009988 [Ensete ventricosum]